MDWIKKHYDQFALAVVSVAALALAIFLHLGTQNFGERFATAVAQVIPNNTIPPVVLDQIDQANALLANPPVWKVPPPDRASDRGSLFVSNHYMIGTDGLPIPPAKGSIYKDSLTGKDIPNIWFLDNHLPLFDPTVRLQDPDLDGFPNEVEWRYHTDPNNKESHPPYYVMLFLRQVRQVPFRLKFSSYDGDPQKDKIDKFTFFINKIDLRGATEELKMGDMVPGTKYKVEKFEYKTAKNDSTGEFDDVSELTLLNTETGDRAVLILDKVVNSPEYYAVFDYEWPQPDQPPLKPREIIVKKAGIFVLPPNVNPGKDFYKLVDIKGATAVIQLPPGQTAADGSNMVTIIPDPRKK